MRGKIALALIALTAGSVAACSKKPASKHVQLPPQQIEEEIFMAEQAFAQTMADRDFEGFQAFLSDDVVFFLGEEKLRGSSAVAQAWEQYFTSEEPPFFWAPERVAALSGQNMALSRGPVTDPYSGEVLGTYTSVWQLDEAAQEWRVIFDIGGCACDER